MVYINNIFNILGNFVKKVKIVTIICIELILFVLMEIIVLILCLVIFIISFVIIFFSEKFSLILVDNLLKDLCIRAAILLKCVILLRGIWGFDV